MDNSTGYLLGAVAWLLIGAVFACADASQRARFDRALTLKYPRTTGERSLKSRVGFALMYVLAGPCGLQSILLSNRRDLVGDEFWRAAR